LRSNRAKSSIEGMRLAGIIASAAALAAVAVLNVHATIDRPVTWTPDALYYQARLLELRGVDHDAAVARTFRGPISSELRSRDPEHTGNPTWVDYNEPFYERRVAVPLAGAALYPVDGDRSLLDLSLAGYVASILALFGLLLLRFRLAVAAAVALATIFLPALVHHSSYPLTDSWGLALESTAFAAALLAFDRGRRWLALWVLAILLLSFTRDSVWIPVFAVGFCAWRMRSRTGVWLFGTGIAAALPALALFGAPVRQLLALLVNGGDLPANDSWGFIIRHYPHALVELLRANGGFLRDGEWYTALYFLAGAVLLVVALVRRLDDRTTRTLMGAGAVLAVLYVLAAPVFSAFRLELVFVPMAAYGIAVGLEALLSRLVARAPERVVLGSP
jgi:hypothetical protein